jgi:hypothetical protein
MRGFEVLGDQLEDALTVSVKKYMLNHGRRPNLVNPRTFTEKQLLFKFFGPIPGPTPSDKLRSPAYTPLDVRPLVQLPKRPFIYAEPRLPEDAEIAPGNYFFKSNHGSGTNQRVVFPMANETRAVLLQRAATWISRAHNPGLSLWWYETMPRNVYIEEDLGSETSDAPDWKFFVCNGRVEIFQVDVDRSGNHVQTIYDRNGEFLPYELYFKSGKPVIMPARLEDMIRVAEAIGRNFDFIRVDLFLRDNSIYLGEIGLVPNGATKSIRSGEIDERLGAAWQAPWMGKVGKGFPTGHYDRITIGPESW